MQHTSKIIMLNSYTLNEKFFSIKLYTQIYDDGSKFYSIQRSWTNITNSGYKLTDIIEKEEKELKDCQAVINEEIESMYKTEELLPIYMTLYKEQEKLISKLIKTKEMIK